MPPCHPAPGGLSRRNIGSPPPASGCGHRRHRGSPRRRRLGAPAGARRCRCGSGGPGRPPGGGRVRGRGWRGPRPPPRRVVGPAGRRALCCRSSAGAAGRLGSPVAVARGAVGGRHLQGKQELDSSEASYAHCIYPWELLGGWLLPVPTLSFTLCPPTLLAHFLCAPMSHAASDPLILHAKGHRGHPSMACCGSPPIQNGITPTLGHLQSHTHPSSKTITGPPLQHGHTIKSSVGKSQRPVPFCAGARSQPKSTPAALLARPRDLPGSGLWATT